MTGSRHVGRWTFGGRRAFFRRFSAAGLCRCVRVSVAPGSRGPYPWGTDYRQCHTVRETADTAHRCHGAPARCLYAPL